MKNLYNGNLLTKWPTNNIIKKIFKMILKNISKISIKLYFSNSVFIKLKLKKLIGNPMKELVEPKVSIIIPTYNCENKVKIAIDSCLKQTYKKIEIIVIDDGSNDQTRINVKKINNKRIKYFYQENKGPGNARNHGITKSDAKYIYFLDADDRLPKYAIKSLVLFAENAQADFAMGKTMRVHDNGEMQYLWHKKLFQHTRISNAKKEPKLLHDTNSTNKLFLKEWWEKNGLEFQNILYEDKLLSWRFWNSAEHVVIVDYLTYVWNVGAQGSSITTSQDYKNITDRIEVIEKILNDPMTNESNNEIVRFTIEHDLDIIEKNVNSSYEEEILSVFFEILLNSKIVNNIFTHTELSKMKATLKKKKFEELKRQFKEIIGD